MYLILNPALEWRTLPLTLKAEVDKKWLVDYLPSVFQIIIFIIRNFHLSTFTNVIFWLLRTFFFFFLQDWVNVLSYFETTAFDRNIKAKHPFPLNPLRPLSPAWDWRTPPLTGTRWMLVNVFPSVTYNRYIIVTDTLKLLLENTLLHFYQSNISTWYQTHQTLTVGTFNWIDLWSWIF